MNLKRGDTIDVKLTDMGFGGIALGKLTNKELHNFVIFIEGAIPGDTVRARLTKIKTQYAEAKLEEILQRSPERITARCRHFGVCGGCSLQFLKYEDQLKWKQKMVCDVLMKIAHLTIEVSPIIPCKSSWYYRNKMEYSFGEGQKSNITLGLHEKKRFNAVFDMQECFLQSPRSVEILQAVKQWVVERKLAAYDPQRNAGLLRTLTVREGKNTGECMVNLTISSKESTYDKEFTQYMQQMFPGVTSLYRTSITVQRGRRTTIEELLLAGKGTLTEVLSVTSTSSTVPISLHFAILPQAFFQPNTAQAELLYSNILNTAGVSPCDTVLGNL